MTRVSWVGCVGPSALDILLLELIDSILLVVAGLPGGYPKTFRSEKRLNKHDVETHGRAMGLACETGS